MIDLRSDTVTAPDEAMRRAMARAEVGDDVYGEDPTVNRLQARLAEEAGFDAGLLFPTGTMSNQAALAALTTRGTEVILPEGAHVYEFEPGAMANLSGLSPRAVPAPLGVPSVEAVRGAVHVGSNRAPSGLLVLENTHNLAGGTVVPLERQRALVDVAREAGLPAHLDGARAFNAASALDVPLEAVARGFDTVSLCLSKGLGAPAGTVLLGSREVLAEAHRYRKMFGGGMRQAGVLAAAGLHALESGPARLADDHARARRLGEGLDALPGVEVNLEAVQTNMVYARVPEAPAFVAALAERDVRANAVAPDTVRFVTHLHVRDEDVEAALARAAEVLERRAVA